MMTSKHLQVAVALAWLSSTHFALADTAAAGGIPAFTGTDAATQAYCERSRNNTTAAKNTQLERVIPRPANEYFSSGTCLDTIMNTRINIFTMGSVDGILKQLMNMAVNRACSAVMGAWNQTVNDVNGSIGTSVNVPYVGNVASAGVGTGFGGTPINVNGQATSATTVSDTIVGGSSSASSSVESLRNIYR
ncbi:hypothetical protein ACKF11_13825 [Methylobacillus sp. Pita2]|uniref:hypothetical protein n=1 Tax=Methylobacillus sp. Pita2 TaxID=3383245 RepID=UPI0038B4749A